MQWSAVTGDPVIASVAYDSRLRVLEIVMHPVADPTSDSSGRYRYRRVPPDVHRALMSADSAVGYFCMHIMYSFAEEGRRCRPGAVSLRDRDAG